MNKLDNETRARVIACLVEGNSLRATARMTGVHRTTIQNLLRDLGRKCAEYQDNVFRNLKCRKIQCDEIWSFIGCKAKNVTEKNETNGWGDIWTWVAIDAETKLVPCWAVGPRDASTAYEFMHDLKRRLATRVQLTTDGHRAYLWAVEDAFGCEIDYAMLIKLYGPEPQGEARYSPPRCTGTKVGTVSGHPDPAHVSTSFVERQNLTMRMQMRRFTRLTNGFSKKLDNHISAIALHYMYYNFARVHQSLRVTPAMEAGIADHVWTLDEIVALLD